MEGYGPFTLEGFGEQKQHVFTVTLPAPISPGRTETLSNYCHGLHRSFKKNFFFFAKTRTGLEVCHLGIRETVPAATGGLH